MSPCSTHLTPAQLDDAQFFSSPPSSAGVAERVHSEVDSAIIDEACDSRLARSKGPPIEFLARRAPVNVRLIVCSRRNDLLRFLDGGSSTLFQINGGRDGKTVRLCDDLSLCLGGFATLVFFSSDHDISRGGFNCLTPEVADE